jgi:phosphoglycerate dehydrogenase-like enzyme
MSIFVTVQSEEARERLQPLVPGVEIAVWNLVDAPPQRRIDMVVVPYFAPQPSLANLQLVDASVVQMQSLGFRETLPNLRPGTVLCSAAGAHEAAMAEHAIALILSLKRDLPAHLERQRREAWQRSSSAGLRHQRVLLVGNGALAHEITRLLLAFDARVMRVGETPGRDEYGVVMELDEAPRLLPVAEIVILAVPGNAAHDHFVDADFLAEMRDGALLVNVARGSLVDTDALVEELGRGRIAAALDQVSPEPLPSGHPLWRAPNTVLTPHVAGRVQSVPGEVDRLVARQIKALEEGRELENIVAIGGAGPVQNADGQTVQRYRV